MENAVLVILSVISFTMVFTGDFIPHRAVKKSIEQFGMQKMLKEVSDSLLKADIAVVNFESPCAPDFGKSRPLVFNAESHYISDLKSQGFNMFQLANNHILDQGINGLYETIANFKLQNAPFVGIDYKPLIKVIANKKIAFFAFTEFTNFEIPKNALHTPSYLNEKAIFSVESMRDSVDFVVVLVHWGTEYRTEPDAYQKKWAYKLCRAGADLIVGTHPHVIEPVQRLRCGSDTCIVAYSLGNFLSNQGYKYEISHKLSDRRKREGLLLKVIVEHGIISYKNIYLWTINRRYPARFIGVKTE